MKTRSNSICILISLCVLISVFMSGCQNAPNASADSSQTGGAEKCTISISCTELLDNQDKLDGSMLPLIPSDGWMLSAAQTAFEEGESAFDVLKYSCSERGISVEYSGASSTGIYVEGIGNIRAGDAGSTSGWIYTVNGKSPECSSSQYILKDGDEVCFWYTRDYIAAMEGK